MQILLKLDLLIWGFMGPLLCNGDVAWFSYLPIFWSYNNLDLHFMDIYFLVFITFIENGNKDNDRYYSYHQKPHDIIVVQFSFTYKQNVRRY